MKLNRSFPTALNPLVLAIHFASAAMAMPILVHANNIEVKIASGDLAQVLNQYAVQQGVNIILDSKAIAGLKSTGLNGHYELQEGFSQILKDTPYQIQKTPNGYRLEEKTNPTPHTAVVSLATIHSKSGQSTAANTDVSMLPTISLKAPNIQDTLQRTTSLGVLGHKKVLDTPYSVSTKTAEEIEERQTNSLGKIFVGDPSVVTQVNSYSSGWSTPISIRGLKLDETYGYKVNGYSVSAWGGEFPIEVVENVSALKGLTGIMYGFVSPGGTINYQTKQPTEQNLLTTTVGYPSAGILNAHVDAGGRVGEDKQFGYRVNVAKEKGESYNGTDVDNIVASLALDYKILPQLTWKGEVIYQDRHLDNEAALLAWYNYTGTSLPKPIDGSTKHVVKGSFYTMHTALADTGLSWEMNDNWKADLNYGYSRNRNYVNKTFAYITNQAGDYYLNQYQLGGSLIQQQTQVSIDGSFHTGFIKHNLILGGDYRKKSESITSADWFSQTGVGNIYQAQTSYYPNKNSFAQTDLDDMYQKELFINDTLHLNPYLEALIGARYTKYNNQASNYRKEVTTPTYALIYKPIENWSIYASYVEALEEGTQVSLSSSKNYANAGQYLDPTISKQYEIGTKYDGKKWNASLAIYRLDRVASIDENRNGLLYLTQDGVTRYKGIEMMGGYRISPDLNVNLGLLLADPKIEKVSNSNSAIQGNRPADASKIQAVIQANWQVPYWQGMSVHGDVRHFGSTWYNDKNTLKFPSYTLVNIGGAYTTQISNHAVTFRADINNLLNKKYWMSSGAGEPLMLAMSAKVDW